MKEYQPHPISEFFPMMTSEELTSLQNDIKINGLSSPIILFEGKILDGRNRYNACLNLDIEPTYEQYTGNTPYAKVMSLNMERRNLTAGQKACVASEVLPLVIKERKYVSVGKEPTGKDISIQMLDVPKTSRNRTERTIDGIAKAFGTSTKSIEYVTNLKREEPEIYSKVKSGGYSIEDAKRNVKKEEVIQKLEQISKVVQDLPQGKFQTIVLDPPWPMKKINRNVSPEQVEFDYPTMTIEEIKKLDIIKCFADDDCHIFLWTTQKFLPVSFQLFKEWNVKYVFTMVWHKNGGFQPFNLPQYNNEFILYGKIGNPPFVTTKDFDTCFSADRTGHSEKPKEFYDLLTRITAGRRLDCFNRRKIEGFTGWGNESVK